jgi:predicted Fe-Mo cluster-binding NifX family protein
MKVAVTSTLPSFDASVGTKLHSSKYLLIIDTELIVNPDTVEYKVMMNPVMMVSGPAKWKLFSQELFQEDVQVLLSGDCNSEVAKSLGHVGIQVIKGMSGSVRSVVKQFKEMCMADTIIMPVEDIQE